MKKKILALSLAVGCFFGVSTEAEAATFKDLPSHHSLTPIVEELNENGIISGYPDGTYRPNTKMERQHVAALLTRAIPLQNVRPQRYFKDVTVTHRNFTDILALQRAGVTDGTSNGYFNPHGQVTRAQMAKMLTQAFGLKSNGQSHPFKDVPKNYWANDAISALYTNNIAVGNSYGNFQPNRTVTRGEYARFLHRALLLKGNGKIKKPTHQVPQKIEKFSYANDKFYYYGITAGNSRTHVLNYLGKPTKTVYDRATGHESIYFGKMWVGLFNNKVHRMHVPTPASEFRQLMRQYRGPIYFEEPNNSILTNYKLSQLLFYNDSSKWITLGEMDIYRHSYIKDGLYPRIQ